MRQKITWVATFDGAAARVFALKRAPPAKLSEIEWARREGPHKPHFDDAPPRTISSTDSRRSAIDPKTDPERRLETKFVEGFTAFLDEQGAAGAFDHLIIVAGARALGAFRTAAPKALLAKVKDERVGDFVNADEARLLAAVLEN